MNTETLAAASLFSRLMVEPLDLSQLHSVPTGFQSLFAPSRGVGGHQKYAIDSKVIEFDVRKGNRGISTFKHRGIHGEALNKPKHVSGKFTSLARTFPLLHDTGVVTADQLLERAFGESPYQPYTRFKRAQMNAKEIAAEIIRDHLYACEYSAAQMAKTGKMDLIYNTSSTDEQIDTKRDSDHMFTVAASWATAGTSILDSIDSMATYIVEDANQVADVGIIGYNIPGYIAANTEIQTYANLKAAGTAGFQIVYFGDNYKPGPELAWFVKNGFTPLCKLITKRGRTINLFTYEKTYVRSGTTTYYMGAKEFLLMSSKAVCDRQFGPPEKLDPTEQMVRDWDQLFGYNPESPQIPANVEGADGVVNPLMFSCDVMRNGKNSMYDISVQAAPIFTTRDTDAFVYCEDVTSP